jgi:hypothetical protein
LLHSMLLTYKFDLKELSCIHGKNIKYDIFCGWRKNTNKKTFTV